MTVALAGLLIWVLVLTVQELESDVAVAVVGAAVTVIMAVIGLTVGRYLDRKQQIEAEVRLQKIPLYERFLDFWFRVLYQEKLGKTVSEREMLKFFVDFTTSATSWASDDVIREWRTIRQELSQLEGAGEEAPGEVLLLFEDLLLAIRRDTGHPSTRLKRGDLLGLFINDIDEYLQKVS